LLQWKALNKTRFLKDPDSGRRRPLQRPPTEWIRQDRPELRIVDDELWRGVQSRLHQIVKASVALVIRRPAEPARCTRGIY
jgi:site-specific DNA recombinase